MSQRGEGKEADASVAWLYKNTFHLMLPFTDKALPGPARVIGLDAIKLFSYVTNNQRWCLISPDAHYLRICNRRK